MATLHSQGCAGRALDVAWSCERYQVEVGEGHARREGGGLLVARHEVVLHVLDDVSTHAIL